MDSANDFGMFAGGIAEGAGSKPDRVGVGVRVGFRFEPEPFKHLNQPRYRVVRVGQLEGFSPASARAGCVGFGVVLACQGGREDLDELLAGILVTHRPGGGIEQAGPTAAFLRSDPALYESCSGELVKVEAGGGHMLPELLSDSCRVQRLGGGEEGIQNLSAAGRC